MISLTEYCNAMPENQEDIYFITGDSREHIIANPALEYFRNKGYDVLFMTDPIDEWIMQSMFQYLKKSFKPVSKGDFEDKESEDKVKTAETKYGKLVDFLKEALAEKASVVRFSGRLTESPCCLIVDNSALPPHMERLFKAMHQEVPESKRIFELNCDHPLITAFNAKIESGEDKEMLKKYANALYNQALLLEGSPLDNPAEFAATVTELLAAALK